jgi:hypothetical protein
MSNIPAALFRMVAFDDKNKNLMVNPLETIAFSDSVLNPTDSGSQNVVMGAFEPDLYVPGRIIDTFMKESGKAVFVIYKPGEVRIRVPGERTGITWKRENSNHIDTFYYFHPKQVAADSVRYEVEIDKRNTVVVLRPAKKISIPSFNSSIGTLRNTNDTLTIAFSNPLEKFREDRIRLSEDTNAVEPSFLLNNSKEELQIIYPWKENSGYNLLVQDSALLDVYSQFNNRSARGSFRINSSKDYSTLNLKLIRDGSTVPLVVQLLTDRDILIKEITITVSTEWKIPYLDAGKYKIRIIEDQNTNGRWDNGDLLQEVQPERVGYYSGEITLKAFWDLEQSINVDRLLADTRLLRTRSKPVD